MHVVRRHGQTKNKIIKKLQADLDREDPRVQAVLEWLKENYKTAEEIWLVYYRKHAGTPRIPYKHAVEEALCFGWIDSIIKKIDDEKYCRKFTPRKERVSRCQNCESG